MIEQLQRALDNGVTPAELSGIITHLAFYGGWGNAMTAAAVAKDMFAERNIDADQLPAADAAPLPLDEGAEAAWARSVEENTGPASPGLVRDTADVLFRDLWLRPDLIFWFDCFAGFVAGVLAALYYMDPSINVAPDVGGAHLAQSFVYLDHVRGKYVTSVTPIERTASATVRPCDTKTSTCRRFATISSGLGRRARSVLLQASKAILQGGPFQWGKISRRSTASGMSMVGVTPPTAPRRHACRAGRSSR